MKYDQWKTIDFDESKRSSLEQSLQIDPILCQLLVQRSIYTFDDAKRFFRPAWESLHDPFLMADMKKAVERLDLALKNNETILVYGDYDVDGTMSVSFLVQFLLDIGHKKIKYYLPDRYTEGYGLSTKGVNYAVENDVNLLITVDCGIRAQRQVDYARKHSIDVIICDHHLPDDKWPIATAVLDPKRPDCPYPFKELSGCGVAFKFAQGFLQYRKINDTFLQPYTDFVAISIACDIVSMTGENRLLAHFGLQQIHTTKRLGLRALIKASAKKQPINISDLVFGLGPIINASGRMAQADTVIQLMLSKTKNEAFKYIEILKKRNLLRREFDKRTMEEALEKIDAIPDKDQQNSFVLYQPHWHKGVIGIIAARITTLFNRPCIVFTKDNDQLVASARSIAGIDVFNAIATCSDLLINYGGHTYAAGITLEADKLPAFTRQFQDEINKQFVNKSKLTVLDVSATMPLSAITPKFYRILRQYAPFGPNSLSPIFCSKEVHIEGSVEVLKENHLRFMVRDNEDALFPVIGFGLSEYKETLDENSLIDICYNIQENHWMGKKSLQLVIKDFSIANSTQ